MGAFPQGPKALLLCTVLALFAPAPAGALAGDDAPKSVVVHAGSLTVSFSRMEAAFEASHENVDVRRIVHGSATAMSLLTLAGYFDRE